MFESRHFYKSDCLLNFIFLAGRSIESDKIGALHDCAAIMNANIKNRSRFILFRCQGLRRATSIGQDERHEPTERQVNILNCFGDPDPHDPHFLGPPDPDLLARGTNPD